MTPPSPKNFDVKNDDRFPICVEKFFHTSITNKFCYKRRHPNLCHKEVSMYKIASNFPLQKNFNVKTCP